MNVFAQTPFEELSKIQHKYADEGAVVVDKQVIIRMDIVEEQLYITETQEQQEILINDNAMLYREGEVYYGLFNPLLDIEANTLVPLKSRYKPYEVASFLTVDNLDGAIFHDDLKIKKFTYPNISKGAKKQLKYTKQITEPHLINTIYLVKALAIEQQTVIIDVDENIEIGFKEYNLDSLDYTFNITQAKGRKKYQWIFKNLAKYKFEPRSLGYRYDAPQIIPYIEEYTIGDETRKVLGTPRDLHNWYTSLIKEVNTKDNNALKPIVDSLVKDAPNDLEKVRNIYYWVQENIKYIAFEDGYEGFIPRDAVDICQNRYGDCKDMSSIITEMLKIAGIPAYLTWIGTRDIPYTFQQMPTPVVNNHMIATFKDGEDYYFLDATGNFYPLGIPTTHIQGKEAMLHLGQNNYEIVKVPEVDIETNKVEEQINLKIEENKIQGTASLQFSGHPQIDFNYFITGIEEKDRFIKLSNYLEIGSNKFILEDYTLHNIGMMDENPKIDYHFNIEDYVNRHENELYVDMNVGHLLKNAVIDNSRKTALKRRYKKTHQQNIVLDIPMGYTLTYLPQDVQLKYDKFAIDIDYELGNAQVQLRINYYMDYLVLPESSFEDWNEMIDALKEAYTETVVLKKQ